MQCNKNKNRKIFVTRKKKILIKKSVLTFQKIHQQSKEDPESTALAFIEISLPNRQY